MKSFFKYVLATVTGIVISFILLFVVGLIIIGALVSSMSADKETTVAANSLLLIDLKYEVTERTIPDPFEDLELPGFVTTGCPTASHARFSAACRDRTIWIYVTVYLVLHIETARYLFYAGHDECLFIIGYKHGRQGSAARPCAP